MRFSAHRLALGALLAALPVAAHAPAWLEGRLLCPGPGAVLHYPLRTAVWEAYRRGELPSWNGTIFSGTPLLSSYPAGAFYPLMPALAFLPSFTAFQLLLLVSLGATAVLTFFYARRLGAGGLGAYLSSLTFACGPYLLDRLGDTATVVAAPALLLALLAAEAHVARATPTRTVLLAAATALLLLAGSVEGALAGAALLGGRLLAFPLLPRVPGGARPPATLLALGAGLLLAAPQLLPSALALASAPAAPPPLAGASFTGLVLRYASHTPAPALVLAALPVLMGLPVTRGLGLSVVVSLLLPSGRGLVLELALAVLAGLALDAIWSVRRERRGRRLRASFLVASLAAAAALSIAAAVVAPLPQLLAGSVGVLAVSVILFFLTAESPDPLKAGVFLLPLSVSFLLQPQGRQAWAGAPLRSELEGGTPTRAAIERALGPRRGERLLTLVRRDPAGADALDLAYGGLGAPGRRTANGRDPFVSRRRLLAYDGMSATGLLPEPFLRSDPARLRVLGVRWVQVPATELATAAGAEGMGERLDLVVESERPRFLALPLTPVTELRLLTSLSDAVSVPQGEPAARVVLRLASGHELPLPLRAGVETAEWSYDREDVRPRVRHQRAEPGESFREKGWGFQGHRYRAILKLPGRFLLDGLRVEKLPGAGRLALWRLGLFDALTGRTTAVSLPSAYLSDTLLFREAAATPGVRLFEVRGAFGAARVVDGLRVLPDEAAVLEVLRAPTRAGLDPRREALLAAAEAKDVDLPEASRGSRAEVVRVEGNRLDLLALGPGLLVVTEGWDPGWQAEVDGHPARLLRVNATLTGLVLEEGSHFVALRHRARGLLPGLALAALGLLGLLTAWRRI